MRDSGKGYVEMFKSRVNWMCMFGLFIFGAETARATPEPDHEITVVVKRDGETILVDVSFVVMASVQEAWEVLTDYDHMAQFLPNVQSSAVIERSGNKLKVAQKGRSSRGLLSFALDYVREVELDPYKEIHSHLISGSLKKLDGVTRLTPAGAGTRVVYRSESLPNVWVPPGIGPLFIENEMRKQFEDMRAEILRRKGSEKK